MSPAPWSGSSRRQRKGKSFSGTGFLIAPDTILTNHHVLHDGGGEQVEQVEIWFNYELDGARRPREVDRYEGKVSTIAGDAALDWAVIRSGKPVKPSSYPDLRYPPIQAE